MNAAPCEKSCAPTVCVGTSGRLNDQQSLGLLVAALNATANAVVITNVDGEIRWVNASFTRLTGYTAQEAIGQNPRLLKSGVHSKSFYRALWQTVLAGEVWKGEVTNRRKDGSLYSEEQTITPVRDATGTITHFIAIKQDISERKQLEQKVRLGQKMQAVGQLAAGVAHDFNNILNVIMGYCELGLLKLPADDPLRAYLREAHSAGERAANLTRQLLAFSRKQVLQPRLINLNAVISDLHKMLRRLIREDIELFIVPAAQLKQVNADPSQIEQVIVNLALNARDAMPTGGKLTVETKSVEFDEQYARLHPGVTAGRYVMLAISDTGVGMDAETKSRIFEPFFTTKGIGKGTGLGLATVYGIVKQSGGFIWVYSEPSMGSTFKVYLPEVKTEPQTAHSTPSSLSTARGTETVLFVEDEPALRELGRQILESNGYAVLRAANGQEALNVADQAATAIDILVTDVVLPTMNGRALADKLLVLRPEMRVLYVSGYTDDAIASHGVLESGVSFLQKPYSAGDLLRKIRLTLDVRPSAPTA